MAETTDSEKPVYKFESLGVHAGLSRKENVSFVFENSAHGAAIFNMTAEAFCYSRIANPTVSVFEARMAALEGGEAALATSSGSAALFTTITALAQRGSNIVVASSVSESTAHILKHRLPPLGINARFVENGSIEKVGEAVDKDTKFVLAESISGDELFVSDIEALAEAAHSKGIPFIVDNTAGAGGFLIRPIDHGADIVIQDASPWISISGSNSAGIIIDSGKFDWSQSPERFPQFFEPSPGFHGLKIWEKFGKLSFISYARAAIMRDTGPCLNPFEAFQLIAGLETLSVRLERISSNSLKLAEWLRDNERVVAVRYPGLSKHATFRLNTKYLKRGYGGLLSVSLAGSPDILQRLPGKLKLVSLGQSIGGSRTIIVPQSGGSSEANPTVWISVGLESIDDIIADLKQALPNSEK
ncbi:related to cystathionine beta-lyases/cystathionine gamma-synthases [Phialocephala subalpina]|uniref:Related to cystathionine beta-lyases/cystathionine gamma-synthases n=1 Tax=Phialocephala subalpina TaxID=576137 RepID=A0A1L7XKA4_9HELO|nr:related to cystathionine beta-lyases/cystathionine gamma-synthases [Phialocephala subalpina]